MNTSKTSTHNNKELTAELLAVQTSLQLLNKKLEALEEKYDEVHRKLYSVRTALRYIKDNGWILSNSPGSLIIPFDPDAGHFNTTLANLSSSIPPF